MKQLLILTLTLLIHICAYTQGRQVFFKEDNDNVSLYDSKITSDGNIIHIGYVIDETQPNPPYNYESLFMKTDKSGNVLWSKKLATYFIRGLRVIEAANGDYLVLQKGTWPAVSRISPNGQVWWSYQYTYASTYGDYIGGIAELPNGNIVICGANDFQFQSSAPQLQGYLLITNPNGGIMSLKSYGHHNSPTNAEYMFNDVVSLGNRILVVGQFTQTTGSFAWADAGLVMMFDQNGNVVQNKYCATPHANKFRDIIVKNGKLFVNGELGPNNADWGSKQLIASFDTISFQLKGVAVATPNYQNFGTPGMFVKDSTEVYSVANPWNFGPPYARRTFITKIAHDTIAWCRKLVDTTGLFTSSLAVASDTVFLSGARKNQGFYSWFNQSAPSSALCNTFDSTVQIVSVQDTFATPEEPPTIYNLWISVLNPYNSHDACIHEMNLCGTGPCNPLLHVNLHSTGPLSVCYGDSVLLYTTGCYENKWYLNDTLLNVSGDTLFAKASGTYKVVVNNSLCSDTSVSIVVTVHQLPPTPVISMLPADTLVATSAAYYQWLDHTLNAIPGATQQHFVPSASGTYYVRITDSNGCSATSDYFQIVLTNIEDQDWAPLPKIYPNPARKVFTIDLPFAGLADITISDIAGKTMQAITQRQKKCEYSLSALGLQPGIYFIKINSRNNIAAYKLVIVN